MEKIILFASILINIHTCSGQDNILKQQLECWQRDFINNSPDFRFVGFSYTELSKMMVKQLHNGKVVDSFHMNLFIDGRRVRNREDSLSLSFEGDLDFHSIHLKDTYQFCIPSSPIYTLSNIKTIAQQVYGNGVGPFIFCKIGQFDLNGVTYVDVDPVFKKDSSKPSK